jgi:hypothetical protein
MNDPTLSYILSHLTASAPGLLVVFLGMVVSLFFLRRCPLPALLTVLACGVFLATGLAMIFIQAWLFNQQQEAGWDAAETARLMSSIGIGGNVLRATALALLILAVFVGRTAPASGERGRG